MLKHHTSSQMKFSYLLFVLLLAFSSPIFSQETLILSKSKFDSTGLFELAKAKEWLFHSGNDAGWVASKLNTTTWQRFRPVDISPELADKNGRFEGWFSIKFRLDSTMMKNSVELRKRSWAAAEIYLDGKLIQTYGRTGTNGHQDQFEEDRIPLYTSSLPLSLTPLQEHQLVVHVVDYPSRYFSYSDYDRFLRFNTPSFSKGVEEEEKKVFGYAIFWVALQVIITFLLALLSLLHLYEKRLIRLLLGIMIFCVFYSLATWLRFFNCTYTQDIFLYLLLQCGAWGMCVLSPPALFYLIGYKISRNGLLLSVFMVVLLAALSVFTPISSLFLGYMQALIVLTGLVFTLVKYHKIVGIHWVLVAGIFSGGLIDILMVIFNTLGIKYNSYLYTTGILISLPVSFIIYLVLRLKEILQEIKDKAQQLVQLSEEKQQILSTQNETLERQVEARTAELKASQAQLIQKEKLASLGELTAGIAHEIQNPLNFVNNFSELSVELIEELKSPLTPDGGILDGQKMDMDLFDDVVQNLEKINLHGKRASSIVKGMLEHSRQSTGKREPTDLNQLADEYLRLAYHGMKAKDNNRVTAQFQAEYELIADENLPLVNVVPQDIGRVLLNLINNAFYAVNQRRNLQGLQDLTGLTTYQPKVTVTTKASSNAIEIKVQDNGTGMSEATKAKIFQPFFTTKPTGEGTGLGLSLAYDIVTKGHGGMLEVESREGEGTVMTIYIPI